MSQTGWALMGLHSKLRGVPRGFAIRRLKLRVPGNKSTKQPVLYLPKLHLTKTKLIQDWQAKADASCTTGVFLWMFIHNIYFALKVRSGLVARGGVLV